MNRYVEWMSRYAHADGGFIRRWRAERMREMLRRLALPRGATVLDLGGTEALWSLVDHDLRVTLLNLPGSDVRLVDSARFRLLHGDACALPELADQSFDLAFSNSVIEHVGDEPRQAAFAAEVRRIGRAYWVQTPSDAFPLEAHTGVPFYWRLPAAARDRLLERWRAKSPVWAYAIEHTRVLSRARMHALFPDASVFIERRLGLEKSYALYRPAGDATPS